MSEESPEYKADPAADPAVPPEPPAAPADPPAVSEAEQGKDKVIILTVDKYKELTDALTAKDTELSEAKKTLDARTQDFGVIKMGYDEAVGAYRKLAVSSNPIFSEDLITGSTIAEVDASMKKVNDLAGNIKTRLQEELKETIIPAGAPERSGPDTSGMSPREKIKAGIQNK